MSSLVDLTGQRFGRLQVVGRAGKTFSGRAVWECLCDCGRIGNVVGCALTSGNTQSCGCLGAENRRRSLTTHGLKKTPEYTAWRNMRARCADKEDPDYGGRGIEVCERWQAFENFLADMGPRPSAAHSIDRIDVNGMYEPSNCRWATAVEQSRNRRALQGAIAPGVRSVEGKFRAQIKVGSQVKHLGTFDNLFDAVAARRAAENRYWTDSSETANQ